MTAYELGRVDGRDLPTPTEPGNDRLLSEDVRQRIRLLVMEQAGDL